MWQKCFHRDRCDIGSKPRTMTGRLERPIKRAERLAVVKIILSTFVNEETGDDVSPAKASGKYAWIFARADCNRLSIDIY